jgi:hypothetical protein
VALVRRLPVYAAGLGFTLAIVAVADAKKWSGLTIALVSLGVAIFYVATMLVPWLIREQNASAVSAYATLAAASTAPVRNGSSSTAVFHVAIRLADGSTRLIEDVPSIATPTHGPATLTPSAPRVATG